MREHFIDGHPDQSFARGSVHHGDARLADKMPELRIVPAARADADAAPLRV